MLFDMFLYLSVIVIVALVAVYLTRHVKPTL